jgi:hypothetical protein
VSRAGALGAGAVGVGAGAVASELVFEAGAGAGASAVGFAGGSDGAGEVPPRPEYAKTAINTTAATPAPPSHIIRRAPSLLSMRVEANDGS